MKISRLSGEPISPRHQSQSLLPLFSQQVLFFWLWLVWLPQSTTWVIWLPTCSSREMHTNSKNGNLAAWQNSCFLKKSVKVIELPFQAKVIISFSVNPACMYLGWITHHIEFSLFIFFTHLWTPLEESFLIYLCTCSTSFYAPHKWLKNGY